jgi:hypothetical protein
MGEKPMTDDMPGPPEAPEDWTPPEPPAPPDPPAGYIGRQSPASYQPPPTYQQPPYPQAPRQQPYQPPPYQQRSPEEELRRVKNHRTVLIVVLAVIGLFFALVFVGCYSACNGCQKVITTMSKDAWHSEGWGWSNGVGPSSQGDSLLYAPPARPEDKAPADLVKDKAAKEGLRRIYEGLQAYHQQAGGYPSDLAPGGEVSRYVDPWPVNPWSGLPMQDSLHRGDYSYSAYSDEGVDLIVHLSP